MMNIIHIDADTHFLLDEWIQKNKELEVLSSTRNMAYFEKCMLDYQQYQCYVEHKKNIVIRIKFDGLTMLKVTATYTPNGENEYSLNYVFQNDMFIENHADLVKQIFSDYISINVLFYFGNYIENNNAKIQSRSKDKDKHYFIKGFESKIYVVNSTYRKSPEGIFSVRGHFRKYKSGKVIWIDEFLKGTEK